MILASASLGHWALPGLAALVYGLVALAGKRLSARAARVSLMLAWLLHGCAIGQDLFSTPPHFGFAQTCSITVWLMMTVYLVESQVMPQMKARLALAGFGTAVLLLTLAFPGHPLPPTHSVLLPLHWALGIAAYGLFAVAVVHGWVMARSESRIRQGQEADAGVPLLKLERLTFRFVAAGFVLLTATLLVGTLFGEALYGKAHLGWRWDHKRVFALLSWLVFAVLLFGRWRFGWRGKRALRMLYAGSALLLLAYVGSRFVLEVVLRTPA
ncbi:cytochrome C assembly protein [Comamonas serinivorans]|uniref:Cytochrome C assembly protein n=1 Tax=Comamonas serinivorans TaxID=1082851 RepID=A0A1Y0ERP2_9BURK|nr:cytochrome c biogenesis protein CcsA [Comamonas serinivorans]ARU05922.1 cytochrome C assembly protein [Comamonas serinivorans]